ncbi:OmpW/AlkL family protein [Steroidobacter sp.]|uniref:OmpW/AlkL family protein n=1 Tax=Steroidobacter sp. TaxID=1978227 RepID=UPI001A387F06|nr:OmpW family outer membrane protein [Steroidobacter sp.]MBL8269729.1 OmpW family protein [Steroidobacter sp.]
MSIRSAVLISLAVAAVPAAQAQDAGEWIWRTGVHTVQPKSDNHAVVNVDSAAMLTFSGTYMFAPNWGAEVLAALPFSHDINLNGGGKVAETKHLPPTVSLQYHFNPNGSVRPYVGVGLNYTLFFNEDTTGALRGSKLELESSFGPAAQLGLDVALNSDWFVNADVRWFDIDTKAKLNGAKLGTVEIDPYAFGVSIGRRF